MKMIKNILFIAVLSITSLCNGMEPEVPKKSKWVNALSGTLLGDAVDKFLSFIQSEPSTRFNFGGLPEDIQKYIITLLAEYSNATSLTEAGKAINALARTNKKLNILLNEPQFCFDLIRFLAQRFKTSDEDAARVVATKEVQRQYRLQHKLYLYVCEGQWKKFENDIKLLCATEKDVNKADINFLYKSGKTVLMCAAEDLDMELFNFLVGLGADINFANHEGVTALMMAADFASFHDLYMPFQQLLNAHKDFNLNQQDAAGNTALMYALMEMQAATGTIEVLLEAGVDPELANFAGQTPLAYIEENVNWYDSKDAVIALLKDAIQKKHEKK
jgi:hypothetical protein